MRILSRFGMRSIIGLALALALAAFFFGGGGDAIRYKKAPVVRGDLLVEISASGTVEPEEAVDVGAQVAGQILELGLDTDGKPIDYGSGVDEGMVLARIDPALYQSDVSQAEAQLKRAEADLTQLRAKEVQAEREWKRAQQLGPSDALSQSAYDTFQSNVEAARANVKVGEAAIVQAQANLSRAQRNLAYTVIKSPVKGVIIDRRVNVGQTVVSSLNTPSLFLIAKDLGRMEVWVSVNEADIGRIYAGQPVNFTVDAFPGQKFEGKVRKIRLNASMAQNVVTYIVEVETSNQEGKLLPYLTANVRFEVANKKDVLMVPNAALRFTPPGKGDNRERGRPNQDPGRPAGEKQFRVWIASGRDVKEVRVKRLETDGNNTEIESPELKEGDEVLVGVETTTDAGSGSANNPFAPPPFRGGRRQ